MDNTEYPAALELHKIYRVLPDPDAEQDGDVRVIDESGIPRVTYSHPEIINPLLLAHLS